ETFRCDVLGGRHVLAACVVHQRVDAAMTLEYAVDERLDLILLADVAGDRLATAFRTQRNGVLERLEPPAADDHMRTKRSELNRGRAADPGSAARNDDHL